jgi:hypothetical protein
MDTVQYLSKAIYFGGVIGVGGFILTTFLPPEVVLGFYIATITYGAMEL